MTYKVTLTKGTTSLVYYGDAEGVWEFLGRQGKFGVAKVESLKATSPWEETTISPALMPLRGARPHTH